MLCYIIIVYIYTHLITRYGIGNSRYFYGQAITVSHNIYIHIHTRVYINLDTYVCTHQHTDTCLHDPPIIGISCTHRRPITRTRYNGCRYV